MRSEESLWFHNKRMTAGLLAAAGKFCLTANVCDYIWERLQWKEAHEYSRQLHRSNILDVWCATTVNFRLHIFPNSLMELALMKTWTAQFEWRVTRDQPTTWVSNTRCATGLPETNPYLRKSNDEHMLAMLLAGGFKPHKVIIADTAPAAVKV